MSKRDEIAKTLAEARTMLGFQEAALRANRVTIEALELALHEEEERIQYDAYLSEQEKADAEVF